MHYIKFWYFSVNYLKNSELHRDFLNVALTKISVYPINLDFRLLPFLDGGNLFDFRCYRRTTTLNLD
jgi:hypothetical protein